MSVWFLRLHKHSSHSQMSNPRMSIPKMSNAKMSNNVLADYNQAYIYIYIYIYIVRQRCKANLNYQRCARTSSYNLITVTEGSVAPVEVILDLQFQAYNLLSVNPREADDLPSPEPRHQRI